MWLRLGRTAADQTTLEKRMPAGLKLSCSSLAFSDMEWDAALAEIKKLGFRYADLAMFEGWTHRPFPSMLTDPDGHAKKIVAACGKLEIEPIAIHAEFVLGDRQTFPGLTVPDAAARKTILIQFERVVSCARAAEIPLINVQAGKFIDGTPRETCLKNAIDLLTQMHAMAARRGLTLSFENHSGTIAELPEDALRILTDVPGLRLDFDPSHIVRNSISPEATVSLMKHVAHVGIRNAKPGDYNLPIKDGKLYFDIKPFLAAFQEKAVKAFVSIEYYEPSMRDNIPKLKQILEAEGIAAS